MITSSGIKTLCVFFTGIAGLLSSYGQLTTFEKDPLKNSTATYEEMGTYYQELVKGRTDAKWIAIGASDIGKPLHLLVLSADGDFDPVSIKSKGKAVLFINNGIHPGEPEGIDASMMFARDLLKNQRLSTNLVVCMVPVYNIAGMLNRGVSRVNQNGPTSYGFRGSRENYDLNRDFIKGDSKNARLFQQLFNIWKPNVFFDTHASNGADYQYVMTLIETQSDKIHPLLSSYMKRSFTEPMYAAMEANGLPMIPYVNTMGETPESGLVAFLETPRYSTGYAALHHCIGFMPETHMWKPYGQRVMATYRLMDILYELAVKEAKVLVELQTKVKKDVCEQEHFTLTWKLDSTVVSSIDFLGFEALTKKSEISGFSRLYYDRTKPYKKKVPYYGKYLPDIVVKKPKAYMVPQGYDKVLELLRLNGVQMEQLQRDTVLTLEMYSILSYKTMQSPYEGHYLHYDVKVQPKKMRRTFYAGDWLVSVNQETNRYIVETLEPQASDSFFNWNFFDAVLSQKEYFSSYIFEEEAAKILANDPQLKIVFEEAKRSDISLRENARAQLDWIYKRSPYYEDTHMLYPIGRIL